MSVFEIYNGLFYDKYELYTVAKCRPRFLRKLYLKCIHFGKIALVSFIALLMLMRYSGDNCDIAAYATSIQLMSLFYWLPSEFR